MLFPLFNLKLPLPSLPFASAPPPTGAPGQMGLFCSHRLLLWYGTTCHVVGEPQTADNQQIVGYSCAQTTVLVFLVPYGWGNTQQ
jgi:hypothetical protein